ncbi:APC family permease [Thermoproteota archaeon]
MKKRHIPLFDLFSLRLKKELGLLEVFCISSGAMISSGLFILPALVFTKTGSAMLISYLLASLLVIPTILAKSELVTVLPKTGGIFIFADRSMGPIMGTLAGLSAWFSLAFKTAFALLGMGIFLILIFPDISSIQIKIAAVVCCLFFTIINIIGVKLTSRFQSIMVIFLFGLLILYIIAGSQYIDLTHFAPFMPRGLGSVFASAGLVFIAFSGTTKIAAVAGEVKNPSRDLPWGLFLSWGIVSLLYLGTIFVTIGIVSPETLGLSSTPISAGGFAIMGQPGRILMSIAALLAFVTTGNAGILATSRTPMAMSENELLPAAFCKVSRFSTPWISILATAGFMISIILFLDLEIFIKVASTLKLFLFTLVNLALIFMRRSKSAHYQPAFRAPLCPWLQLIGISAYIFLIYKMGWIPIVLVSIFTLLGLLWYFVFAHPKIKREYIFIRLIKKAINSVSSDYILDEELREVLIVKDHHSKHTFIQKLHNSLVIDLEDDHVSEEFYKQFAEMLCSKIICNADETIVHLKEPESINSVIKKQDFSVVLVHVPGKNVFELVIVREKKENKAVFYIVSSFEKHKFYIRSLKWLIQIGEHIDFKNEWKQAKNKNELCDIVLKHARRDTPEYTFPV